MITQKSKLTLLLLSLTYENTKIKLKSGNLKVSQILRWFDEMSPIYLRHLNIDSELLLRRIRRYGFIGRLCHGRQADLSLKTSCLLWCTLCFWYPQTGTELRMWTLSFLSSAMHPVCYYSPCHDADELYFLWKCKPQITPSYYKLPWP